MKYLLALLTTFLPMCAVTGDHNTVRTSLHINVSIVPAIDTETRP